jgi:hypothetical protein
MSDTLRNELLCLVPDRRRLESHGSRTPEELDLGTFIECDISLKIVAYLSLCPPASFCHCSWSESLSVGAVRMRCELRISCCTLGILRKLVAPSPHERGRPSSVAQVSASPETLADIPDKYTSCDLESPSGAPQVPEAS